MPSARSLLFAYLFLVTVVLTLAWAVVGCLLGFDRWLQLPAHWSWHKDADWEGQISFGGLALLLVILTITRLALSGNEAAPDAAPLDSAGLISRCTFWWVMPTLSRCFSKGKLDLGDLPLLPRDDLPRALYARFATIWSCHQSRNCGWRHWRLFVVVLYSIQRPRLPAVSADWLVLTGRDVP